MMYFKYYAATIILIIGALLIFGIIIPWGVSQPNDIIVILSIIIGALTLFFVPYIGLKILKNVIIQINKNKE